MGPASSHHIQVVGVRPARCWHQLCPFPVEAPGRGPGSLPPSPELQRGGRPCCSSSQGTWLAGCEPDARGPPLAQVLPVTLSRGPGRGAGLTHGPGRAPSSGHHHVAGASGSTGAPSAVVHFTAFWTNLGCRSPLSFTDAHSLCCARGLARIWGRRSGRQPRPSKWLCGRCVNRPAGGMARAGGEGEPRPGDVGARGGLLRGKVLWLPRQGEPPYLSRPPLH